MKRVEPVGLATADQVLPSKCRMLLLWPVAQPSVAESNDAESSSGPPDVTLNVQFVPSKCRSVSSLPTIQGCPDGSIVTEEKSSLATAAATGGGRIPSFQVIPSKRRT